MEVQVVGALIGLYGIAFGLVALVVMSIRETAGLRADVATLRGDFVAFRADLQAEFAKIRQELADRGADLSAEISDVRERLARLEKG
jgi:predicted nuclease with TOPRIM domain